MRDATARDLLELGLTEATMNILMPGGPQLAGPSCWRSGCACCRCLDSGLVLDICCLEPCVATCSRLAAL